MLLLGNNNHLMNINYIIFFIKHVYQTKATGVVGKVKRFEVYHSMLPVYKCTSKVIFFLVRM